MDMIFFYVFNNLCPSGRWNCIVNITLYKTWTCTFFKHYKNAIHNIPLSINQKNILEINVLCISNIAVALYTETLIWR